MKFQQNSIVRVTMFSDTLTFFTLLEQEHEYHLCSIFIENKAERKITGNLHLPNRRSCINKLQQKPISTTRNYSFWKKQILKA